MPCQYPLLDLDYDGDTVTVSPSVIWKRKEVRTSFRLSGVLRQCLSSTADLSGRRQVLQDAFTRHLAGHTDDVRIAPLPSPYLLTRANLSVGGTDHADPGRAHEYSQ